MKEFSCRMCGKAMGGMIKGSIRNGHVVRWTDLSGTLLAYAKKALPPRPLPTYPVRIEGDRVLVDTG